MNTCKSCGTEVESQERFAYCAECNIKRNDPALRPRVWEYTGGVLGSLQNRRGSLSYTLADMGFNFRCMRDNIPIYMREDDGTPNGLIALVTPDGYMVILAGQFELESLWQHPCKFTENPSIMNIPKSISSLSPENFDMVMKAKQDAGLT